MGYIEAVCISREKGELKMAVQEIALKADWGIEAMLMRATGTVRCHCLRARAWIECA